MFGDSLSLRLEEPTVGKRELALVLELVHHFVCQCLKESTPSSYPSINVDAWVYVTRKH